MQVRKLKSYKIYRYIYMTYAHNYVLIAYGSAQKKLSSRFTQRTVFR